MAMPSAAAPMAISESALGLSVGGAKDVNNFRENINNGYLPLPTDITYEGLYYDYYFDTGKTQECSKLFCPSYSKAVSADPYSNETEYFLTVGLNSGIKESDFLRKKLNLVVVLDISGSMSSSFDRYYYDRYGNRRQLTPEEEKEASKSKIRVATESIVAMTKHLRSDDRFGVVLFDETAYLAKPLSLVGNTDMDKIRQHILDIREQGSTNMEAGIREGTLLFKKMELDGANQNEYENRIIFLTDAQPNTGDTSESGFMGLTRKNAADKIYMTFIGIGVDFNTGLIEEITKVRGANYYSVHSSQEFANRMDDEFDYMVTPLVFNLELNIKASGYEIEEVYGSPEADLATGQLMKVNTLFPSKTTSEGTKGGVVLLQLKKVSENPTLTLVTSYEDRTGKTGGDRATINFGSQKPEYFENSGIRKAILLARYANVIKDWIYDERSHREWRQPQPWEPMIDSMRGIYIMPRPYPSLGQWERQSIPLQVSAAYKKIFGLFGTYFGREMTAIGDKDLQQESDILKKLSQ
jgi:Ca-activated chloride channel family protein